MNNENLAAISILSEIYKTEVLASIVFTAIAGFLGGVLSCKVDDYFTGIINNQQRSFSTLKKYICNGLLWGLGASIIIFSVFKSYYIPSIKTVENIGISGVIIAIFYPSIQALIIGILNKIIFRDDNFYFIYFDE